MGNSNSEEKIPTPQEYFNSLEALLMKACESGQYFLYWQSKRPLPDATRELLRIFLEKEGFDLTQRELRGRQIINQIGGYLSWKDATVGKAKVCRDKSDAYWTSRAGKLKWNLLKEEGEGEEGEGVTGVSDTPQASAPPGN